MELDAYAGCTPGLEDLVRAELAALDLEPGPTGAGGVPFACDPGGLMRAALHLRIAGRVLVRLDRFHARDFHALERRARRLPWDPFVPQGGLVRFDVTCRKSRLNHAGAVSERLERAALEAGRAVAAGPEEASGAQRVVVRFFRDRCTVSVDATGEHLHRRGYRLATARAPLRETLAAAALVASDWDGGEPLLDPMCGSGTLVLEAALLARRLPPGLHRDFAFTGWPLVDGAAWEGARAGAAARVLDRAPVPLVGSDRDPGAVEAALANGERAGVAADVDFRRAVISEAAPPPGPPGLLVTNPPYGRRIGRADRLRDLYAALGNVARARFGGWRLTVISSDATLVRRVGIPLEAALSTRSGGVAVGVWTGPVPASD